MNLNEDVIVVIFIGIDPGLAGGIGIINTEDNSAIAYKYTPDKLIEVLHTLVDKDNVHFTVEQVHAMPKQGVSSTFTFGTGYGMILGILRANGIIPQNAKPSVWKRKLGVTADKQTSIHKAMKLFPNTSLLPTPRCRVPSDGLAEALLIAEYGRLTYKQNK